MPVPMIRRCMIGVSLSLLIAMITPSLAADPSFPPALSIGLVPPSGMTPSTSFAGFEHRSGASIVFVEMPAEAYPQIVAGFTPERLRTTGFIANGDGEALPVSGAEGRLLRGHQTANGITYNKWVAVVKGPTGTGLVTVQVPESGNDAVPATAVEAALRTIAFRAAANLQDQIAALPYTVRDLAGFRPVRVLAGSSLLLTKGPKDVDPDGTQPIVIIASAMGQAAVPTGQEGALARKAFGTLAGLNDLKVTDEPKPASAAERVVRLRGTAKHSKSEQPMRVTQTILFTDSSYLRIIGIAPASAVDAIPEAERIANSAAFR